jgi:protein gp37
MSAGTKIDWAGLGLDRKATWNPLKALSNLYYDEDHAHKAGWACVKIGPGCKNCYAETMNKRLGTGLPYTVQGMEAVDLQLVNIEQPLRWKKPTGIFVCSMTDLFGEFVGNDYIHQILNTCALANHHRFALLTKRYDLMHKYLMDNYIADGWDYRHIWVGVSVTEQASADKALPHMRQLRKAFPQMMLWTSYEPALGPVDWTGWKDILNWIVFGCESGKGARNADERWASDAQEWCAANGVKFYLKQLKRDGKIVHVPQLHGRTYEEFPEL